MSAPGDIYEFVITGRSIASGEIAVNVFHFRAVTPGCTATSLIADWRTNLETAWKGAFTSDLVIERYLAFNLIPYNTDVAEQRVNVPGTNGSTSVPYLVAAIITWRTGLLGRRKRGRTYFAAVRDAYVINGQISGWNTTSPWQALGTAMLARYGATGSSSDTRLGVWSRVNGNQTPPHNPAGFQQITAFEVQRNVGSMGTRRRGRGA